MPNPSVASARNTPDSRIAGTAMISPTGMATRPASSSAGNQGTPWSLTRWQNAAAPTAANAYWHSDTCPDSRTRSPSDRNRINVIRPMVQNDRLFPTMSGTIASSDDEDHSETDAHPSGRRVRVARWRRRRRAPLHEQALRRDQECDEQHDERQTRRQTTEPADVAHVLRRHRRARCRSQGRRCR